MTQSLSSLGERLFQPAIGTVAATALAADLTRHPGPKHGLVIGAEAAVISAAMHALTPADSLTVVAGPAIQTVREQIANAGEWTHQRVRVVELLAEADEPADSIIVGQLLGSQLGHSLASSSDETRAQLDDLAKQLAPGGVISAAVPAAAFLAGGAGVELDRQSALYGIGSDLVLRNVPPVRIHRLRYSPAEIELADRVDPLARTSSVRLTSAMNIDSNGLVAAGVCLAAAAVVKRVAPRSGFWLAPLAAALPVAAFFRDPQRVVPDDPSAVVAASDGRVLAVERVRDERLHDGEFLRVSVFLSVFDVHINRAPVAGRVVDHFVIDVPGPTGPSGSGSGDWLGALYRGYAPAMRPEAEHNVCAYTILQSTHGTVAVAQRTGLIARRIVSRTRVGALLAKGERFGLIRFGSRTDVYLPADSAIATVAAGDRVAGGETVIARWI